MKILGMQNRFSFTEEEATIINRCDNPEKAQAFLNELEYNYEDTAHSFRGVVRNKKANCLEGALAAASILSLHGYPPIILCMEARDMDHNIFVFRQEGRIGSVAKSRDDNLLGRLPKYWTHRQLVMSYYPYYYNLFTQDRNDLTLRGYALLNLGEFYQNWITAEEDLLFIEKRLYEIRYRALFPIDGKRFYYSPNESGSIVLSDI